MLSRAKYDVIHPLNLLTQKAETHIELTLDLHDLAASHSFLPLHCAAQIATAKINVIKSDSRRD